MISSITYSGDSANRIFPVSFEIKGEEYVAVFINDVGVSDKTKYDIINNSIVFIEEEAPIIGVGNVVIAVATTPSEIADLGAPPSGVQTVVDNLVNINRIVDEIIPNLAEILLADDNATIATTKAGEALISKNSAEASATTATTQAEIATTKAEEASTSANNSDTSEANALLYSQTATTQANIATTKAGEALTSANNAHNSELQAETYAASLDPTKIVAKDSPTGAAYLPSGTTIQRPLSPINGYMRYNSDLVAMEAYVNGAWGSVGGSAQGGNTDKVFYENDQIITANYTITSGKNAITAGNVTINSGVTVTVPTGSRWTIV